MNPLSSEQKQIWTAFIQDSPNHYLVDACPGAGKTNLLLQGVAELVSKGGTDPLDGSIVLLTYNKQLSQMYTERLEELGICPQHQSLYHVGTFDALAWRYLGDNRDPCNLNFARQFVERGAVIEGEREQLQKVKYIFVDEYQDMRPAHLEILSALARHASPECRILAVGDIRQTLYASDSSNPACPMSVRSFRPWVFKQMNQSFRCPSSVVKLMNSAFQMIDWDNPCNQKWKDAKAAILEPVQSHRDAPPESSSAVVYLRLSPGSLRCSEQLLQAVLAVARGDRGDSLAILSPIVYSPKAWPMMLSLRMGLQESLGHERCPEIKTVQSSKGLEWDRVILLNCFENSPSGFEWTFQSWKVESCIKLFVAISRPKKGLWLIDNRVHYNWTIPILSCPGVSLAPGSSRVLLDGHGEDTRGDKEETIALAAKVDLDEERRGLWRDPQDQKEEDGAATTSACVRVERLYPSFSHPFANQHNNRVLSFTAFDFFLRFHLNPSEPVLPWWISERENTGRSNRKAKISNSSVLTRYSSMMGVPISPSQAPSTALVVLESAINHMVRINKPRAQRSKQERLWSHARLALGPTPLLLPIFDFSSVAKLTPVIVQEEDDVEITPSLDFWTDAIPVVVERMVRNNAAFGTVQKWDVPLSMTTTTDQGKLHTTVSGTAHVLWVHATKPELEMWYFVSTEGVEDSKCVQRMIHFRNLLLHAYPAVADPKIYTVSLLEGKMAALTSPFSATTPDPDRNRTKRKRTGGDTQSG